MKLNACYRGGSYAETPPQKGEVIMAKVVKLAEAIFPEEPSAPEERLLEVNSLYDDVQEIEGHVNWLVGYFKWYRQKNQKLTKRHQLALKEIQIILAGWREDLNNELIALETELGLEDEPAVA